jgi:1-acyl-sn-glycerol-3-phosphate acyltransferase
MQHAFGQHIYFAMAPGWKLDIEGKEDIKKGSKYVLVSNHESLIDILLLMQLFIPFRWITKIEMSRVPVLGWVIIMNKYIPVKRGDKDSKEVMLECAKDR